ncbi:lysine-specific demethylase 5A-like isoform X2 [Rhopilema esculentum]|uniref:lysine-specific demethylase 5A-like isoform X2 n=1 Tax=Rhopilema esculentum TaxID=499914 RepID=UPI0031DAA3EE
MYAEGERVTFIQPPEAPVFEPNEEEFKDPLAFIAKIRPFAEKIGICKIRPPPEWQPPFCVDVEKFKFTPRIQRLNELEVKTRVKLNFLDSIAKFWELQGSALKIPNVDKKPLDLYLLHKVVQEEGGFEDVTRQRKWSKVAQKMGFKQTDGRGYPMLRSHYEKILFPFDVFRSGAMTGDSLEAQARKAKSVKYEDGEYIPKTKSRMSRKTEQDFFNINDLDLENNKEFQKLRFAAPGPKMIDSKQIKQEPDFDSRQSLKIKGHYDPKSDLKEVRELTRRRPGRTTREKKQAQSFTVDDYMCQVCDRGDSEESMLLCDGCDASYHTFCLIPPLSSVPPGDWRCPRCVAQECSKPQEAYGFEQAKTVYSLREFGVMADKFKEEYFGVPAHEVPTEIVEDEFWRLVSSLDDEVVVEYGADLHTFDHGSGFPTRSNTDDPDDEKYIKSWWNLNNLPVHEKSVLGFISADISGMKIPWIYVGMCFSSFCWHIEDHWSYSINYMHWGEPKTWYGVPSHAAEKFEDCMKKAAPELFEAQPDLLHHLVTIINPNTLMNAGVPIVRTNQYAGEFVVTFPRAYHAGFNQGYNFAEAVNFCPADWLPMGRRCIDHYRSMNRCPVFSHEELICKIASNPDDLDLDLAKAVYDDMEAMVKEEVYLRVELKRKGVSEAEREAFELLPDDERQCSICKTALFFSAIVCSCRKDQMSCLYHADELCPCGIMKKSIKYRYNIDELPSMLSQLKKRADSFDNWCQDVKTILECAQEEKHEVSELKELLAEAEQNQFSSCELLDQLKSAVAEAEQCAQVATQLFVKKHKTRHSSGLSPGPKLTLSELREFVQQVDNLSCVIKEARLVTGLLNQVENFQYEATCILEDSTCDIQKLTDLVEHGQTLDIDLPELTSLKQELRGARWLEKAKAIQKSNNDITLDDLRSLIDQGMKLQKKPAEACSYNLLTTDFSVIEKPLRELKELLFKSDRWEEKAKLCLQAKPKLAVSTIVAIVREATKFKVILPNINTLKEALENVRDWAQKVERIQNDVNYPYLDVLEELVARGRPLPVRLDLLPQMESQVAAARAWKDRTSKIFVKKGSALPLFEIIAPRKEIVKSSLAVKNKKKKEREDKEKQGETEMENEPEFINLDDYVAPDPSTRLKELKEEERIEKDLISNLRKVNLQRIENECVDGPFCLCGKGIDGLMVRCCLCYDWFHSSCISLPKVVNGKPILKGQTAFDIMKDLKYMCPLCTRSRRPRLETILGLLVSLQKLPVRLPEGDALQFLIERIMKWQEKVKPVLEDKAVEPLLLTLLLKKKLSTASMSNGNSKLSTTKITFKRIVNENLEFGPGIFEKGIVGGIKNAEEKKQSEDEEMESLPVIRPREVNSSIAIEGKQAKLDVRKSEVKEVDDPLTLECEEEMTESPKSSGSREDGVTETEGSDHSALSQKPSGAQSPVDVCSVSAETTSNSVEKKPVEIGDLRKIEELLMEGDLLEVTMDETQHLWMILNSQRPLLLEDCKVMDHEYRRMLTKSNKKKKRKIEESTQRPIISSGLKKDTKEVPKKKVKKLAATTTKGDTEAKDVDVVETEDVEDSDEDCAAKPCRQPTGDEVGWVQCDPCSSWYHVACIGITAEAADAMETYVCPPCEASGKGFSVSSAVSQN